MKFVYSIVLLMSFQLAWGQGVVKYQLPPKEIADEFSVKTTEFEVSRNGKWVLIRSKDAYPSVVQIAHKTLSLAGVHANPENFASGSVQDLVSEIKLKHARSGKEVAIKGLPEPLNASGFKWNASATKVAFIQVGRKSVDLYVIDLSSATARKVNRTPLHTVLGEPFAWAGNDLYYKGIVKPASEAPVKISLPEGPYVLESDGKTGYVETYSTSLISSTYEEALFAFYTTAQLIRNSAGAEVKVGEPMMYKGFQVSPDGRYVLASVMERPFSNQISYEGLPSSERILDRAGKGVSVIHKEPLKTSLRTDVARSFAWRGDRPATVYWIAPAAPHETYVHAVCALSYPFTQKPEVLFHSGQAITSVVWSDDGKAWINQAAWRDTMQKISLYNPATKKTELLYEVGRRQHLNRLGNPATFINKYGQKVIYPAKGNRIIVSNHLGNAASGGVPFVASFHTDSKTFDFIWKGGKDTSIHQVVDPVSSLLLIQNGKPGQSVSYQLVKGSSEGEVVYKQEKRVSALDSVTYEIIPYYRADSILLTGRLYLPAGYDPKTDGRLPLVIWGYPRQFVSLSEFKPEAPVAKRTGLQVMNWEYPQVIVTQGYAFFDADMPVLPKGDKKGNERYIEELVMNAEAAINALAEAGIADRERVAIAGHSYGGAMTATLLAHSKLFKAGMAMSGGYNRSHTPFGFQDERQTMWEVKEVYKNLSALNFADQIKTPLLLIHGDSDVQIGTAPTESEALFKAIQGTKGVARYVSLPYEGHGFVARENILHWLYEMNAWLEKYVKNAKY